MANSTCLEDFNTLVVKMMKVKGVKNFEFFRDGETNEGDGFTGEIIFFKVIILEENSCHHLVMKMANTNEKVRKFTNLKMNFEREIYLYTTIFNTLNSFASSKNISSSISYVPRLFWWSRELKTEVLVLENLRTKEFIMWKKKELLNFEHTMLVIRNLAKWHGTVMAYRDQNTDDFMRWIPHLQDLRLPLLEKIGLMKFTKEYYRKVIKLLEERGHKDLAKKYGKFEDNLESMFSPSAEENDRLVVTHGDIWINNIMFKYGENKNIPSECKFYDFQFSRLNTPVEDLSYFVYSACDETVLDNLDIVLQEYHSTLSSTIRNLGSNPDRIFTLNQLHEHWKKYGLFGVLSSVEILKLKYCTEDEFPDFLKILASEQLIEREVLGKPIKDEKQFLEEVMRVFRQFGKKYL